MEWGEIKAPKWEPNRTAWLLTCVDLTSLLVGFFVLLFSTSTLQRDKWQAITGSFQAQFAKNATVVAVVPDSADNAVIRVTGAKSGLVYLDTLLHQRLQGDPVWANLSAEQNREGSGQDMRYVLPDSVPDDAWARLGSVVRGWKNPVGIRMTTSPAQAGTQVHKAVAIAQKLSNSGVVSAFVDIRAVDGMGTPVVELVVRAQ
jgi:hypothetical protein